MLVHRCPGTPGGTDDMGNLQLLCSYCNRSKTMEEWQDGNGQIVEIRCALSDHPPPPPQPVLSGG